MFNRYKILAAYMLAVPLALLLGIMAASPDELTFMLLAILLFCLALPLFINWHHALLIVVWNSAFVAAFLPGQPTFLFLFAGLSFGISVLNRVIGKKTFLPAAEMNAPLALLAVVVLGTACYRGGIGLRAMGGSVYGGKYYLLILSAIMGYYALTAEAIPLLKGRRMAGLFFFSGATYILSNIIYTLGPGFYFFYYIVPSSFAVDQAASDYGLSTNDRIQGLAPACVAVLCFLLAAYGIRGLLSVAKPWRLVLLLVAVGGSFFAGFRSIVVLICLILTFQLYFEGFLRARLMPVLVGVVFCTMASVFLFAGKMPLSVQRAISFLPINVDAGVRADAMGSWEWRRQMWEVVWKEVPKYLLVGKGYATDPTELYVVSEAARTGMGLNEFEGSMLAGDYHNGPLSVIMPFGIAGVVAFVWVLVAGYRVLHSNFRYGDPKLRLVNSAMLSYYLANIISFVLIFGAFNGQLYVFLGAVGISVSLNGGVRRQTRLVMEPVRGSVTRAFAVERG